MSDLPPGIPEAEMHVRSLPVPVPGALDWRDVPTYSEKDLQKAVAVAIARERERIAELAGHRDATCPGDLVPCRCRSDCRILVRRMIPFADLLGEKQ